MSKSISVLTKSSLYRDILASNFTNIIVVRTAWFAKIRIALSDRQVTRTLLSVTLSLTEAAWESILTWKKKGQLNILIIFLKRNNFQ